MRAGLYLGLLIVATGAALWKGTTGERWVAGIMLAGNLLTLLLVETIARSFASVSALFMILDATLALLLCLVAVRYPSWVTILVSAFQINGTLGHLVKLAAPQTIPFSYAFLLRFWAWPMVLVLLLSRFFQRLRTILKASDWPAGLLRR